MTVILKHVLPKSNIAFASYDEFKKRILSLLKRNCLKEPDQSFESLIESLYTMNFDDYVYIVNELKCDYNTLKKNADSIKNVIDNSDLPIPKINSIIEMEYGVSQVVCRGLDNILPKDPTIEDYQECMNGIYCDSDEIKVMQKAYMENFKEYADDELLKDVYKEKVNEIYQETLRRINRRLKACSYREHKIKESDLDHHASNRKNRMIKIKNLNS